jgi:biopolymer transport protein ExbD
MGMSNAKSEGKKGKKSRSPLAEINVTPLVDVMLVLLIIFMVAAGVQTVEMQSERQKAQDLAQEKLEEAEDLLAEFERKKEQHTQVPIDLPNVNSEPVKLSEVKKLKLVVDDQLKFKIDKATLVDCLAVSPDMKRFLGKERDPNDPEGERVAFEPCLKALGEKLVDNKKLQEDKELYVLASRSLHYGQVLRVMAAVRQAGVTKFGLVAEADILGGATVEKTPPPIP